MAVSLPYSWTVRPVGVVTLQHQRMQSVPCNKFQLNFAISDEDQVLVIGCALAHRAQSLPVLSLGPFHGAIAVPSVTRRRRRGHRCAGGVRQWRQ